MFEDVVSPHGAPAGRRRLTAGPIAIGAHALVIGVALVSALLNGEDLLAPDPPMPVIYVPAPPASPGGPTTAAGPRAGAPTTVRAIRTTVAPHEIPKAVPSAEDLDGAAWEDSGAPVGDGEGPPRDPSGFDGATGDGGACASCPPGGETIHEIGGEIAAPRLVQRVEPEYSPAAVRLRIQGFVIVRAIIGLDGRVEDVRVEKSLFPSLDEASVAAVRQWRYQPATLRGRAVRVALTVTVSFELK